MTEENRRPLEPGMLLLDPDYHGNPQLWTVKSAGKKSATLIAGFVFASVTARLLVGHVPDGWKVLDSSALAVELAERGENIPTQDRASVS